MDAFPLQIRLLDPQHGKIPFQGELQDGRMAAESKSLGSELKMESTKWGPFVVLVLVFVFVVPFFFSGRGEGWTPFSVDGVLLFDSQTTGYVVSDSDSHVPRPVSH